MGISKNILNLRNFIDFDEKFILFKVIKHHVTILLFFLIIATIIWHLTTGEWGGKDGTISDIIFYAYFSIVPISLASYFTNKLFPNNKIKINSWMAFYYIHLHNFVTGILVLFIPYFIWIVFEYKSHEEFRKTDLLDIKTIGPLVAFFIFMLFLIILVSAKNFLNLSVRHFLIYLMLSVYFWIPISVISITVQEIWSAISEKYSGNFSSIVAIIDKIFF